MNISSSNLSSGTPVAGAPSFDLQSEPTRQALVTMLGAIDALLRTALAGLQQGSAPGMAPPAMPQGAWSAAGMPLWPGPVPTPAQAGIGMPPGAVASAPAQTMLPAAAVIEPDPAAQAAAAAAERKDKRVQTISILGRYADKFSKGGPKSQADIQKMIDDKSTPPDLREALKYLQKDHGLSNKLDGAYRHGKTDGLIADSDIKTLSQDPEVQAYNRREAKLFEQNYIPSDDAGHVKQGRPMTANDALRELYRYSDNLPPEIGRKDLQEIVDGTGFKGNEGKRPPQLIAAAQYFLDHPSQWKDLTGKSGDDAIGQDRLKNAISANVRLTDGEWETIDTLRSHRDAFFGHGYLNEDGLKKLAKDSDPEVAKAARQLLDDPMLLHMLDNGKHGHDHSFFHNSDDGKIGEGDLDAFVDKLKSKTPAPVLPTFAPTSPDATSAVAAMLCGELNQPDPKEKKGGQFDNILHGVLKVFSIIEDVASKVLGAVASLKIPIFSQLAAAGSMATNAISGGLKVADAQLETGDAKGTAIKAGISFAEQGVSVATAPGVGNAIEAGATQIGTAAAKAGAKQLGKDGLKELGEREYDAWRTSDVADGPGEEASRALAEDAMSGPGVFRA